MLKIIQGRDFASHEPRKASMDDVDRIECHLTVADHAKPDE